MKQNLTLLAAVALVALPAAFAAPRTPRQLREAQVSEPFRWTPKARALGQEWQGLSLPRQSTLKSVVSATDTQLPTSENVAYLDMPDGTTWFVTCDYEKTQVGGSEYYADYDYTGIKAIIYDDKYEPVGYIESPIEKPEGFDKCSDVQFGACVTRKFFNTNDAYEVMVMLNFKPEGAYGAVPFTYVFSLKGAETPAEKIATLDGYYTQAVNNAADRFSEDFFMTFFAGEEISDGDSENGTLPDWVYKFDIYTKASWSSPSATKLATIPVNMFYASGDGDNETLPVLINSRGRTLYVAQSQYEKTFFEDPLDITNDKLSEDNKFLIKLLKKGDYDTELTEVGTTEIPCEAAEEGFSMRTYCIGALSGGDDISFDFGDDDEYPAYVVSVANSNFNQDDRLGYFDVISFDGAKLKTFGRGYAGYMRLSPVAGEPEQYCFLMPTGPGDLDLEYCMFDYPSMEQVAAIPVTVEYQGMRMALSLALDRVHDGDGYGYAVATTQGVSDDSGNMSHLVAWFDEDGHMLKIDSLVAGKNVNLISPYIVANGLGRYLFNTDEAREYMILVQRRQSAAEGVAHTELMVVNDAGETLMQIPFAAEDSQISVALVNESSNPAIWISYKSFAEQNLHSEFVSLPLNKFEGNGTQADPYLLRTRGDVEQIKFNLNKHFRLANDIDYGYDEFESVPGLFTGSIDGAGHTLKNFVLDGKPMFSMMGSVGAVEPTFIKDLNLRNVSVADAPALLVSTAYASLLENIHVVNAIVTGENVTDFGTLVNNAAMGTEIRLCGVRADIMLPETSDVGGLASTLGNESGITASSYMGDMQAQSVAAGLVANAMSSSVITDCHVMASIGARHTVGGVVAVSSRGEVARCLVEGALTATEPRAVWSEYAGGTVPMIIVGGVAGQLDTAPVEYDQNGQPIEPDPNLPPVIHDCVVALDVIDIPTDEPALKATAHRIVGRSCVNNDPAIIGEEYDETLGDWVITWGDPAKAEDKLAGNYAVSSLAVIDGDVPDNTSSTEGAGVADDALDRAFFEERGFRFAGMNAAEPWLIVEDALPVLYFEPVMSQYMEFFPGTVEAKVGETAAAALYMEEIDVESLTFESSDETRCMATPVGFNDDGDLTVGIRCTEIGDYTVTATNGNVSAVLLVRATSGIEGVTVSEGMRYDGMSVAADGEITVYSMAGTAVASGTGAVDVSRLVKGVYVAVAVAPDGNRMTLKFNLK